MTPERVFIPGPESADPESAGPESPARQRPTRPLSPSAPWARFRLRTDRPFDRELERIARDQLLGAAALVEDRVEERGDAHGQLDEQAVHESRRALTRVRGLLRLARSAMPDEAYREANTRIRDLARSLSGSRDAAVTLATFDKLAAKLARKLARSASLKQHAELDQLRAELADSLDPSAALAPTAQPPPPGELVRELEDIADDVPAWPIDAGDAGDEQGLRAVRPGFERTYRRARKAMAAAERQGDAESFHEWRKRVKHVRAQLRLLRDVRKAKMRQLIGEFEDLADLLGDEHDLDLVEAALDRLDTRHPGAMQMVRDKVDRRRRKLRTRALTRGRTALAPKPKSLSRRLEKWWSTA